MTQTSYDRYLDHMRSMHREQPRWFLSGAAMIYDYITEDNSQYTKALAALAADVYGALCLNNTVSIDAASTLARLYDPYNRFQMSSDAYRFVIKVIADLLGIAVNIDVATLGDSFFAAPLTQYETPRTDSPDVARLKAYRNRLLDFSKTNQLVHFKRFEKSCIGIASPAPADLLSLLTTHERVYLEHWESLRLTQILECAQCGAQFFRPYTAKDATLSQECPNCDANKKTKHAKAIKEAPILLDYGPLKLTCPSCTAGNDITDAPTASPTCRICKTPLSLPSSPVFSTATSKSRLGAYCIAASADATTQRAAYNLYRRTRDLELNFGLHPLYLACGFLKWSSHIGQEYTSPLLLLKINLSLDRQKGKYFIALDKTDDEPISLNRTLQKMLGNYSKEVSVVLPPYQEGTPYFDYTVCVYAKLGEYDFASDWTIDNQSAIGIFNYQKLQLEKDLDDHFNEYLTHPIIRRLCGQEPEDIPADPDKVESRDLLVLDADSSQSQVIDAALSGESFLLQGPPGTGKSQTITNIIAAALAAQKTVLFVAEKASARSIIWDNLSALPKDGVHRLTDFIYNADYITASATRGTAPTRSSQKNLSKNAFMQFYNDRFAACDKSISSATELPSLSHMESKIEQLYDHLSRQIDSCTVRELIGIWSQYADAKDLAIASGLAYTFDELRALEDNVSTYYHFVKKFGISHTLHPLYGFTEVDPTLPSLANIEAALAARDEIATTLATFACATGLSFDFPYDTWEQSVSTLQMWSELPAEICNRFSDSAFSNITDAEQLRTVLKESLAYARTRRRDYEKTLAVQDDSFRFRATVLPRFYDFDFRALFDELQDYQSPFSRLSGRYKRLKRSVFEMLLYPDKSLSHKEILSLLADLAALQAAHAQYRAFEVGFWEDQERLWELTNGWETDWVSVCRTLEKGIKAVATEPIPLSNHLFRYLRQAELGVMATDELSSVADTLRGKLRQMNESIAATASAFDRKVLDVSTAPLRKILEKFKEIDCYRDDLFDWVKLQSFFASIESNRIALHVLAQLRDKGICELSEAIRSLRHAYYKSMIFKALGRSAHSVTMFDRGAHEQLLAQYAKADTDRLHQNAVSLYDSLAKVKNNACTQSSRYRRKLIPSVNGISLKELIKKNWSVIKTITPCFMMSPLSVSQYLDIDTKFDLVIFDEASQIFLEDSFASIVRGKQVIISGDRQQLPPSDFFRASDLESEDDTLFYEEDATMDRSVLDASIRSSMNEMSLKWHYRSRDESLICFSNEHFYSNSLVTFPAAAQDPELRLIHHPVPHGRYLSGNQHTNPDEADEVVRLIWAEMTSPTRCHLTLGVVAFSVAQAREIEERWHAFVASSPEARAVVSDWEATEAHQSAPLVFCNLDTIQGDERDTMIVSTTYGKNPKEEFNLLFLGPVRQSGGAKRINVAITRARSRMIVVTSMTSELLRMQLNKSNGSSNEGAEMLCAFLRYAESEKTSTPSSMRAIEGDWIRSICKILDEEHIYYDVGIGLSECKIDIGIKASPTSTEYLLGILTDGQGLGGQSIREYARLRQQVLTERYGWKLHHIWLAAWFLDYKAEKDRLIAKVKSILLDHEIESH